MAQIPVPNFGQSTEQPAQAASPQNLDTTSGVEQGLNAVARAYQDYQARQLSVKTSLALATATNDAHDAHDEVARGLQDGSIPPDQAEDQLHQRLDAITAAQTQNLPDHAAAAVKTQMVATAGALSRSMAGNVFKYNQSETAANQDELGKQLQRDVAARGPSAVADTYDAIMDMTGAAAGFTPAQIQAKKIAYRQDTTTGYYTNKGSVLHAAGAAAIQAGDKAAFGTSLSGLTDTLNEVLGPAGEQMSLSQRATVTNHLVGLQNQLLAQQRRNDALDEAARLQRENDAVDAVNAVRTVILNGSYLSPDAIADASAKAAGTSQQQALTLLLASQSKIAGFATLPADQRAATIERYHAEGANPAIGTSPQNQQSIALLEKVDAKANDAARDNPWQAAQTYGVIVNAPVMDFSNPGNVAQQLDVRMQQIGKVEAWVGHKVSPLQPAEAEALGHTLKGMPPDQAASTLSTIGQMVADPDRIGAVAKQLGKGMGDDASMIDTLGLAMAYSGDRTNDGKLTAEWLLRGQSALKNKTSLPDQTRQSGWKAQIATQIDGAFSSQGANDSAIKAAFLIANANGGDVDAAIKAATGGIITHGLGKIPLPVNVDESTFNKRLGEMTPAMLAPQAPDGNAYVGGIAMPLAKFTASLPDATLVHAGQGLYVIKAGTNFVTNRDGQRIVLRITQ